MRVSDGYFYLFIFKFCNLIYYIMHDCSQLQWRQSLLFCCTGVHLNMFMLHSIFSHEHRKFLSWKFFWHPLYEFLIFILIYFINYLFLVCLIYFFSVWNIPPTVFYTQSDLPNLNFRNQEFITEHDFWIRRVFIILEASFSVFFVPRIFYTLVKMK